MQRSGAAAEAQLDGAAQEVASSVFEHARTWKTPNPAWYQVRQRAKNLVLDAVADHGPAAARVTTGFAKATKDKVVDNTAERLHPRHLVTLARNPGAAATYYQQKMQPLAKLADLYEKPRETVLDMLGQAPHNLKQTARRGMDLVGRLDKTKVSVLGKSFEVPSPRHGADALFDLGANAAATHLGVLGVTALAFQTKGAREKTNAWRRKIVPDEKLTGLRGFVTRKLLNNLVRIPANPVRAAAVFGALSLLKAGDAVEKSRQLEQQDPKRFAQRKANNTHIKGAPIDIAVTKSLTNTSNKPRPG
jgi:hypothetical protein